MTPDLNRGYPRVTLHTPERGQHTKLVHVLVAEAFLGPRPEGQEVNHKDFDRTNNRLANLEWVTRQENLHHLLASGRKKNQRIGTGAVRLIRALKNLGRFTNRELGEMFGVKSYVIWFLTTGRTYRWI